MSLLMWVVAALLLAAAAMLVTGVGAAGLWIGVVAVGVAVVGVEAGPPAPSVTAVGRGNA